MSRTKKDKVADFEDNRAMEYRSALDSRVSHEVIREMGRQGLSIAEISATTGVARVSVEAVIRSAGIRMTDDVLSRPATAPQRFDHRAAVAAVRLGGSYAGVGRAMGVSENAVRYAVYRAGDLS